MLSEARLTKILGLENVWKQKNANHVQKKINCHDKIPWHFPDIGQMAKIPWHFFKIPWQFPDLEKILFFPDFSLTRGNPGFHLPEFELMDSINQNQVNTTSAQVNINCVESRTNQEDRNVPELTSWHSHPGFRINSMSHWLRPVKMVNHLSCCWYNWIKIILTSYPLQ